MPICMRSISSAQNYDDDDDAYDGGGGAFRTCPGMKMERNKIRTQQIESDDG